MIKTSYLIQKIMPLLTDNEFDRTMVFVDLRNVLKSSDRGPQIRVDLYRLLLDLVGKRRLMAAYVFDSRGKFGLDDSARKLHDKLRFLGFRVIARDSYDSETREQKEVDVAMACEMVVHALRDNYDVAIVVSGDRDFVPAIQHVQSAGKRVEVAAFHDSFSAEMMRVCDTYRVLDALPVLSLETKFNIVPLDEDDTEEVNVEGGDVDE